MGLVPCRTREDNALWDSCPVALLDLNLYFVVYAGYGVGYIGLSSLGLRAHFDIALMYHSNCYWIFRIRPPWCLVHFRVIFVYPGRQLPLVMAIRGPRGSLVPPNYAYMDLRTSP
ncbi:hypothetical protein Lal_00025757 [Lupinus albus]|nr:hypothetical protein Lal_00025757 [Lupinus albus]